MARIVTERCICDRCGKDYITKPFWQGFPIIKIQQRSCVRITYKTLRATDDERDWGGQATKELCEDCMRSLNEWFAKGKEGECASCHFNADAWNAHESNWEWRGVQKEE